MCGIYFEEFLGIFDQGNEKLVKAILRDRGPDFYQQITLPPLKKNGERSKTTIFLASSVLHIRGEEICKQPVHIESINSYLQWNGEIFKPNLDEKSSDTTYLALELETKILASQAASTDVAEVLFEVFDKNVEGPFAFVFLHVETQTVHFGRDKLGRRSLMINFNNDQLRLSSASIHHNDNNLLNSWKDLDATKLHSFDFLTRKFTEKIWTPLFPPLYNDMILQPITDEKAINTICDMLYAQFEEAIRRRIDKRLKKHFVMFSGGLDCTIVAASIAKLAPQPMIIKLVNVEFVSNNPKLVGTCSGDRISAREATKELKDLYSESHQATFELLEVTVSAEEYEKEKERILKLCYPNRTIMDLSIACAFYFAAKEVKDMTKLIWSGFGADELFGGYKHHRGHFFAANEKNDILVEEEDKENKDREKKKKDEFNKNWKCLEESLQKDCNQIWKRNCGRDDRVLSSQSIEMRYPFLDESFIRFVHKEIPIYLKCNPLLPLGIGEKWILRKLALRNLDLIETSQRIKRAVQFGSKSAKLEPNHNGTDQI